MARDEQEIDKLANAIMQQKNGKASLYEDYRTHNEWYGMNNTSSMAETRSDARSFDFNGVTELSIPEHQSITKQNVTQHSDLSTVSPQDIAGIDHRDFIRTAPVHRQEFSSWDQAVAQMQVNPVREHPYFMDSTFFTDYQTDVYSGYPDMPQSAPPTYSHYDSAPHSIFGSGTSFIGDYRTDSMTVSEADIFGVGSNVGGHHGNTHGVTHGVNINRTSSLKGNKRQRGWTVTNDKEYRSSTNNQSKKAKRNISGLSETIMFQSDLPPILSGEKLVNEAPRKTKKRGRPSKVKGTTKESYARLEKREREKMRRKEMKDAYTKLTSMLGLEPIKLGAALPDRSEIVAAACAEIRRLNRF